MKKILYVLLLITVFASCNKDEKTANKFLSFEVANTVNTVFFLMEWATHDFPYILYVKKDTPIKFIVASTEKDYQKYYSVLENIPEVDNISVGLDFIPEGYTLVTDFSSFSMEE